MLALYIRVSTNKQGQDGLSLDEQTSEGMEFAKNRNEKYKIYTDIKSAKNIADRDDFRLLLSDIEAGLIDSIWCGDIDRLTRSMEDGGKLKKLLDNKTLKIFDRGKEISAFEFGLRVVLADEERQKIVERTTRNRRKQIDAGDARYPNLYGYRAEIIGKKAKGMPLRKWEVDERDAEIIKLIYDLYEQNFNFDDICAELTSHGYKTKLRGSWDRGTIHLILRRPEYVGLTKNTEGYLIPSTVYAPIIDRAQWDRVQAGIDAKIRNRQGKYFKDKSYDCSGIIKCERCGAPYFYHRQMSKINPRAITYQTYTHKAILYEHRSCKQTPKNLKLESVDLLFAALFALTFGDYRKVEKFIQAEKKKLASGNKDLSRTVARLKKNIDEFEAEKKRLIDAVKKGAMEAEDIADEMANIKERIAAEKVNLAKYDAQTKALEQSEKALLQEYASTNVKTYLAGDSKARRELNMKYIQSATINGYILKVKYVIGASYQIDLQTMEPTEFLLTMVEICLAERQGKIGAYLRTLDVSREEDEEDSPEKRRLVGQSRHSLQSDYLEKVDGEEYESLMESLCISPNNRNKNLTKRPD
jgi:site-specific DNA recombinase